jgi:hypothetical protein
MSEQIAALRKSHFGMVQSWTKSSDESTRNSLNALARAISRTRRPELESHTHRIGSINVQGTEQSRFYIPAEISAIVVRTHEL